MTTGRNLRWGEAVFGGGVAGVGPLIAGSNPSNRWGEAVFGGGVAGLGLLIAFQTVTHAGSVNAVVGPALFPFLIATGLVIIGAALLREAFAGHIAHEGGFELDWLAVVIVSAGLIIQMALMERLGWIPATTLLFMATA